VIDASAGTSLAPWIATILSDYSIHVTSNATVLYMRPPLPTDPGSLYKSTTQNLLFIATGDVLINGTATQTFSSGITRAYEQVSISGNPTYSGGYIIAQDSASSSRLVTSNSISGNMHLTYNGTLTNPVQGLVQTQSTLY
jgi:hypothetical protein